MADSRSFEIIGYRTLSLFPVDCAIPGHAITTLRVRLNGLKLRLVWPFRQLLDGQGGVAAVKPENLRRAGSIKTEIQKLEGKLRRQSRTTGTAS